MEYHEWLENLPHSERETNLFQKDLEHKKYFYTEGLNEKESRLRELWFTTRKKRFESNISNNPKHKEKFIVIRKEISNLIKDLRRKIDQYLIKNRKPVFFGTKIRHYDKEEFLYDAEINFYQIKRFLNQKSSILKKDPSITMNYLDLMEAIKRKKILENSIANFEKPNYYDANKETSLDLDTEEKLSDVLDWHVHDSEFVESEKTPGYEKDDSLKNEVNNKKKLRTKILGQFEQLVKENLNIEEKSVKTISSANAKRIKGLSVEKTLSKSKASQGKKSGKSQVKSSKKTDKDLNKDVKIKHKKKTSGLKSEKLKSKLDKN